MAKQYEHKKLWLVAKKISKDPNRWSRYSYTKNDITYFLEKELIEDSLDWGLQEEKDWIDNAMSEYYSDKDNVRDLNRPYFRKAIEEYMPKINDDDIFNVSIYEDHEERTERLRKLLKEKWLYKE